MQVGRHVVGPLHHADVGAAGERAEAAGEFETVHAVHAEIDDGEPAGADLVNVADGQRFMNCAPDQNYRSYIDHVVLGVKLAEWRVPDSFVRLTSDGRDALERKLADHCPVGVDLRIPR